MFSVRIGLAAALICVAGVALGADEKKKIPEPVDTVLTTADGVKIAMTYYPGTNGKDTVPIVLLHMWKGSRGDYRDLALLLQKQGHAVLVPDLRGHGESTEAGKIEAAKLTPLDFEKMVRFDMAAIKEYLWKKNNEGDLNLNKLCIVGGEMGASVAVAFTVADMVAPYGPLQQGYFVRALVLLSPENMYKGMNMAALLQRLGPANKDIAAIIIVGEKDSSKLVADAKRVHGILERWHPDAETEKNKEKATLFLRTLDTNLQGTKMFKAKELRVEERINTFVNLRLVKSDVARAINWKELKRPHE